MLKAWIRPEELHWSLSVLADPGRGGKQGGMQKLFEYRGQSTEWEVVYWWLEMCWFIFLVVWFKASVESVFYWFSSERVYCMHPSSTSSSSFSSALHIPSVHTYANMHTSYTASILSINQAARKSIVNRNTLHHGFPLSSVAGAPNIPISLLLTNCTPLCFPPGDLEQSVRHANRASLRRRWCERPRTLCTTCTASPASCAADSWPPGMSSTSWRMGGWCARWITRPPNKTVGAYCIFIEAKWFEMMKKKKR